MQIVRVFRARVVDLAPQSLIIEITGAEDKIQALLEVLRPFGIIEMVRPASGHDSRRMSAARPRRTCRDRTGKPAIASKLQPPSQTQSRLRTRV